ncbi:hypothetical protein Vadar_030431 [Vaccinium darrowii]|uniref:Uncharacterized protein n=1 Tax=Vaccinium darrowii TaxID=229202 RepID=A0ACB7Z785_9ERIC|nr:hypothetical protein Vadar_030431 [Vaccinium darrowii]
MVVPLGPGKFYGSSLPRPRIYTDIKFNSDRVDPPTPVSDPLMSWAREAHWSMGGLSFKRFRLQGRIEGNVNKLRSQREKSLKKRNKIAGLTADKILDPDDEEEEEVKDLSPSPPPAPIATKRRRFTAETDQEDGEDNSKRSGGGEMGGGRKRLARKLGKEFDRVAAAVSERGSPAREAETVAGRTRSRKVEESGGGDVSKMNLKAKKRLRRVGEIEEEKAKRAAAAVTESGGLKSGSVVRTSPRLFLR